MFKRFFTISLLLAITASFTMAQNGTYLLKPNGEKTKIASSKSFKEAIVDTKVSTLRGAVATSAFAKPSKVAAGLADTLTYRKVGGTWNTNFGMFGQDIMLQFFEATADMDIKGIGFTCSDDAGAANATVSFRLIKLNWSAEKMKSFTADTWLGYYPSAADGMNNVDPFGEVATGDWVSQNVDSPLPPWTDNASPSANTFAYDLWSDGGFGWPVTPILTPSTDPVYSWIATADLGFEPKVVKGDVFAVVAVNDGITLDGDRIGFWSDATLGLPGWKYYENGRSGATVDPGWWVRLYTWDMALAVEITSDTPPEINDLTELGTTLSTDARMVEATITDGNPGGGPAGVANADLVYTINGGDFMVVPMTANGDVYSAEIPGQSPGTEVTYYVTATDVGGNDAASAQTYAYQIFLAYDKNNLVVFNGYTAPSGYPQSYYWGPDTSYTAEWTYDAWAYGALPKELVDHYRNIFEICTTGPADYNREVIAEWLAGDATRNYLLAGEEWLGADNGYTDQDYAAGSFEYDVLGVAHSYNDVSYDGTAGQALASVFFPQQGTLLGGPMFDYVATVVAGGSAIDSVLYDPMYEISTASNWHDGFEAAAGTEVFMKAETRGVLGAPAVQMVNVGVSHQLTAGNKVVFMTYDPISINSTPTYEWLGRGNQSNVYQSMLWFDALVIGVEENGTLPGSYSLSQNYPNPFNPTTVISYSIPEKADVTLKVFNLLGQEVATLVNASQNVGSHEVNFNASNLTSGVYFYTIKAGDFTSTRKMMLIK